MEISFERFGVKTTKESSRSFSFTILYHPLYSGRSFVHLTEFLVISDYWKVTHIRLVKEGGADYIEYKGIRNESYQRLSNLNAFLESNCYPSEQVTVAMVFNALMDNCRQGLVQMRLFDIYDNYG